MSQILENHLSELTIVKLTVKARIKFYLEVLGFPSFHVIPKHMQNFLQNRKLHSDVS
jgi:hypothetical protein